MVKATMKITILWTEIIMIDFQHLKIIIYFIMLNEKEIKHIKELQKNKGIQEMRFKKIY
jgi:hypothetical protein